MTMQPYRPNLPDSLTRNQRTDLSFVSEFEDYYQKFDSAMKALRLGNAYKLRLMQLEMHVSLGNDIRRTIYECDNPIVAQALRESFEAWIYQSNTILGGQ